MRLWAEERRPGTIELLLTMPITPWQAIVGKFLASWVFLALALALTFPVVVTVNVLGSPDNGVIVAGYLGSLLLAGTYLADQLPDLGDDPQPGHQLHPLGGDLPVPDPRRLQSGHRPARALGEPGGWWTPSPSFSVMTHFEGFQSGVIDLRDLVFFASVIGFALFATSVVIRGHRALRTAS